MKNSTCVKQCTQTQVPAYDCTASFNVLLHTILHSMGVPLLNYVPTSSCWKILRATESANDGASHHTHYYDSSVCVNLQYFLLKCAKARFVVVVTVYSHHFTTEQGWRNLGSSIARHASMLVQNLLIEQIADNCCNKYLAIFLSTYHIPKTVLLLFHTITWDL